MVSGLPHETRGALLTLAFTAAARLNRLTWPHRVTRRLIMQKVRRQPFPLRGIGLRLLVSARVQVLLTPLVAVLFIFQSPYWSTIGRQGVFSLGGWAPQLRAEFHELRATLVSRW